VAEMEGLRVVEYTHELAADALEIRNAIFPPLTMEDWLSTDTMTGALAYLGDEVVGCIPMDQRDFLAAPDAPIKVIFENAVGTREDMRSKGIGSAMIQAAKGFLSDRIDAMMVYRGAERSPGYRFYTKSGHHDLIYVRSSTWDEPAGSPRGVSVGGTAEIAADAAAIHETFTATYGTMGGFPPRSINRQSAQLSHQIYKVLPQETLYFRYPAQGQLEAYCIAGVRAGDRAPDSVALIEMAGRGSTDAMDRVLGGVGAQAAQRGLTVTRYTSHDDPFRGLARGRGFVEGPRHFMIMAQIVRPQGLFEKVCAAPELVADLKIDVWTPTVDYTLHEGPQAKTWVTIEAKDAELTRLLCRRLDVRWAIEHDMISVRNGTPDIAARLGQALPFSPWVYHHIDYI